LADLAPLAVTDKVIFYSLQLGAGYEHSVSPPTGMRLIDLTAQIHDFADTAALIEQLDLVISIDTAVAHLAGALGKPIFTLLPFAPDWRWMLERSDSLWYPTMRVFRQGHQGDWGPVVTRVHSAFDNLLCCNKKSFEVASKDLS
jgi:ADP-heptose:LPS heptosyltransferase